MKKFNLILCISMLSCQFAIGQGICPWPPHGGDNCQNAIAPKPYPIDSLDTRGAVSVDPNEIIGPEGVDSVRWVSVKDILNYTIMFENDPEFATAAAQKVDVRFDFPSKTLQKGFGIGTYCFSNMSYNVDNSPNAYQNRIDLRDSLGIYVDVIGGLDVTKNQAFWTFSTIDPETGYAPWEHDKGLLQVNDSTHVGEGFVTFQLKPPSSMKTGDTISIQANIVFDENDTIPTNRWCNKIDAGNPESKVFGAQDTTTPNAYKLSFTSKDDDGGSGVKSVTLFLANNVGVYEEYGTYAPDSVVTFPTEAGKQYKLFSLATDSTGNMEPLKEEPDLIVNHNQAPTDIALSDTIFNDDIELGGYIGELSSVDSEEGQTFTYNLAEGDGSVHNDMFQIEGTQLQAKQSFKCSEDTVFAVRISTTDEGGLSFSKAFRLHLNRVLEHPKTDTLNVEICEGDVYDFFGQELDKTGEYRYSKSNEYMCDSTFVLNLTVKPIPSAPVLTVENGMTLVSSIEKGNLWFKDDELIEGATEQKYTPTENGVYYVIQSKGSCMSAPSNKYNANISVQSDLVLSLAEGWNWISSNLASAEKKDPKNLLSPIINDVESLVGKNEELTLNAEQGLVGSLTTIDVRNLYKLQVSKSTSLDLSGVVVLPDETPITLQKGWNWIGYVPTSSLSLADAFANHTPQENDMIKGLENFAVYSSGQWIGTLAKLNPGEGYMYYSNTATSFKYPYSRFSEATTASTMSSARATNGSWNVDIHEYPDNMCIIANVIANNSVAPAGVYTIGAFCGDECRGIGEYVNDRLFLTVHGTASDKITFKAIENATGNECSVNETSTMSESLGTISTPYQLHIDKTTGIDGVESDGNYNIYPDPVRNTLYINGNTDKIKGLKVIAISGATMSVANKYDNESGYDVASLIDGNYILGIITDKGIVYKRFLKVSM